MDTRMNHRLRHHQRPGRQLPLLPAVLLLAACLLLLLLLPFAAADSATAAVASQEAGSLIDPAALDESDESQQPPPPPPVPAHAHGRQQRRGAAATQSPRKAPREGQGYDGEEPLLIVGTVDGRVHAVGSEGEVVWSFDSGAPLVSSYYPAGWGADDGASNGNNNNQSPNLPVVIPAVDGSLLVHTPGKGVQRLPLSAAQLVERAPFLAGDGTLYTGARTSEALMVDMGTGKVLQRFSGPSAEKIAHMVDPRVHTQQQGQGQGQEDGGDGSSTSSSQAPAPVPATGGGGGGSGGRQLLWLGKVEHSLRALDPATGQELWHLTVSELSPLFPGAAAGGGGSGPSAAVGTDGGGNLPLAGKGKGGKDATAAGAGGGSSSSGSKVGGGGCGGSSGALAPGRVGPAGSKALLDVLGPGPGWGGAGALLATPDGGLHRRDPTTGRVRLLAPLGAAPVSAFVVAPNGKGVGGAVGGLLGAGAGSGVPVPMVHTLVRGGRGLGDEGSDASSSTASLDGDEDENSGFWDDGPWEDDQDGEERGEQQPQQPLWLPPSTALGGSPTVSIGQLGNGRLFGIVLDPWDDALAGGKGGAAASVLPHYLQHRHDGLPSPSPAPPSNLDTSSLPQPSGPRPPHPATAPGGGVAGGGSLPRIHPHAQRDCPAGYPTSLCSLRRTNPGAASGVGRPTSAAGKPTTPASVPVDDRVDGNDGSGGGEIIPIDGSCHPGSPGFPNCLLGVHYLKALEPRLPPTSSPSSFSSSSSSSSSSGCLPPGTPGSGLLDICMLPLLEPPPPSSSSSDSSSSYTFDWTRPATWSPRFRRDALFLLTLLVGAILMTALGGSTGNSAIDGLWNGGSKQQQQGQSLTPSPTRASAGPVVDAEGNMKVGRLSLSPLVLGYGCHGTIVYRGTLDGRPVAVKRMLRAFHAAADREMRLLIESDGHPNVVRYFLREQAGDFVYLALELCVCSLRDVVARLESWCRRRQLTLEADADAGQEEKEEGSKKKKKKKKRRSPREPAFIGGLLPSPASWQADDSSHNNGSSTATPATVRAALQQIASGLAHLHALRIVHRDIKPHNILLSTPPSNSSEGNSGELVLEEVEDLGGYVCKISDMGVGKLLAMGQSSFGASSFSAGLNHHHLQQQQAHMHPSAAASNGESSDAGSASSSSRGNDASSSSVPHGPGSVGWQAPEVMMGRLTLLGDTAITAAAITDTTLTPSSSANGTPPSSSSRRTQAVDIFSLGCVFYTVLVPGSHPFGHWYERERNILTGEPDLAPLEASPDAHELIKSMLERDPARRPTARMVLGHPFFWDDERRLAFLVDFSDRLELEAADSLLVLAVEAGGSEVVGRAGWDRRLHRALLEDGSRYRKYDTASVRDCLRLLRNKRHHFHDLPKDVQHLMAPLPGGLYRYFQSRFPRLLMHCHGVCIRLLTRDKLFRTYIGGKEVEDDYEEDNASLGLVGGALGGAVVVEAQQQREQGAGVVEGNGEARAMAGTAEGAGGPAFPTPAAAATTTTVAASPAGATASGATTGDREGELLSRVTVFAGGTLAASYGCRGWWRPAEHWARRLDAPGKPKARPQHLTRQLTDGRYRTRFCQHWEGSAGPFAAGGSGSSPEMPVVVPACAMQRKKKCDFAHGPVELRAKEARWGRWGATRDPPGPPSLRSSGGEDAIAQARMAERSRAGAGPGGGVGSGGGGGGGGGGNGSSSGSGSSNRRGQPVAVPAGGGGGGGIDAPSWRRAAQPGDGAGKRFEAPPQPRPPA